jgi:hypothetical protein
MIRTALVVSSDLVELDRWAGWLEAAGFLTVGCAGPRLRPSCPRLQGEHCVLRDAVDVAVVAAPGDRDAVVLEAIPEASCTALPDNGTTILIDESGAMRTVRGSLEHLGPLTERALLEAVEGVLTPGGVPRPRTQAGSRGRRPRQPAAE